MLCSIRSFLIGILTLTCFLLTVQASATVIQYTATDLTDMTAGEDLWQYAYTVSENNFSAFEGFTVWFDYGLYDNITPVSASADWDPTSWNPDLILGFPDDGAYDALTIIDSPSLGTEFVVNFTWLGGLEGPGEQFFDVYDDAFVVIESGITTAMQNSVAVPEPGTMLLVGTGLMGLLGFRPKRLRKITTVEEA